MAKCYVGTYGKYNAGSLSGKWLDLSDYPTYQDFLNACRELHKNEREPEFMIQDWEALPDGFPAEEWIGEKDFNDIKAAIADEEKADLRIIDYSEKAIAVVGDTKTIKDKLKAMGGRFNPKLTCGAGWIFSKKSLDEVKQFLNCGEVVANDKTAAPERDEALWNEYRKRVNNVWPNDTSMQEYRMKKVSDMMMTDCGCILTFEKKKIKVNFCWSDEGAEYEEYKRLHSKEELLREYFVRENMREYDEQIKELTDRKNEYGSIVVPVFYEYDHCSTGLAGYADNIRLLYDYRVNEDENDPRTRDCIHRMTENDCTKALTILKNERDKFEKRLNTYLKRYGTSKLHTWTYWANR